MGGRQWVVPSPGAIATPPPVSQLYPYPVMPQTTSRLTSKPVWTGARSKGRSVLISSLARPLSHRHPTPMFRSCIHDTPDVEDSSL